VKDDAVIMACKRNGEKRLLVKDDAMIMACKRNGEKKLLVGEPEGKRPLGREGHRWVVNIKMDLGERKMEWCEMN
jgi:hypothetical protein